MDQFNRDTYKRETLFQEFYHSCLGKIIILAVLAFVLFVVGVMTVPSDKRLAMQTMDNIHECLQENDSTKNDDLDEMFSNISRTFSTTDTLLTNRDLMDGFLQHNQVEIYNHTAFSTCYVRNTLYPQGVRIGIGIFGMVISTINFNELVMDQGPAHGEYNKKLLPTTTTDTLGFGENPHLTPYHYLDNPED